MSVQLATIVLDREEAQCLLAHAGKTSVEWVALKGSISEWIVSGIPTPSITVQCSEDIARGLLAIADAHCQSAVPKIKHALTAAGITMS